jgi:hypothetical protein
MYHKWTHEDTWVILTLLRGGKKPRKVKKKLKKILAKRGIVNPPSKIHAMSKMQDIYNDAMRRSWVEHYKEQALEEAKQLIKDYLNEE